ncbi:MAG: rod shape-determining protein MreC [Phycisphaeraceae bacterium JB051]
MRRRLLTSKHGLFLAFVLMLVACLLPQSLVTKLWSAPRHLLKLSLSPLQHPLHQLSDQIRAPLEPVVDLGPALQLENNYMELMAYNAKLQQELDEARRFIDQLTQLRTYHKTSDKLLPSRVTLSTRGLEINTLTLGVGAVDQVAVGQVVTAGYNLVGRIASVGTHTSTVRLINTPGTYLAVRIFPPVTDESPRQALAHLQISDDGKVFYARGDVNDPVKVGDLAFLADDRWPTSAQGLIVGQITQVDPDEETPLLRTRLTITPLKSLMHLGQVVVAVPDDPSALRLEGGL